MTVWFGFHKRYSLRKCWKDRRWMMFGHVEAWGTFDLRHWFFFDPEAPRTRLVLETDETVIDEAFGLRLSLCHSVLRFDGAARLVSPLHLPMTCASQCAHLVGLRAYTPGGLRRSLIRNGAVEVKNARPA